MKQLPEAPMRVGNSSLREIDIRTILSLNKNIYKYLKINVLASNFIALLQYSYFKKLTLFGGIYIFHKQ